jgi:hypothetical protein
LQREIGSSRPTTLNELLGNPGTLVQLVKVEGSAFPLIPPLRPPMGFRCDGCDYLSANARLPTILTCLFHI